MTRSPYVLVFEGDADAVGNLWPRSGVDVAAGGIYERASVKRLRELLRELQPAIRRRCADAPLNDFAREPTRAKALTAKPRRNA